MLFLIPKELRKKVEYCYKDIQVKDGKTLTEEERKLFEQTRKDLKKSLNRQLGIED